MDEIKVGNYLEIVTDEYSVPVVTDEEDMQPKVSWQKSQSEVNLFMDDVKVCASVCVCVCASVCVCVCVCVFLQVM
jgi:hypothetical protein